MRAQPWFCTPLTKTGAARLRNLLLCKLFVLQNKSVQRPAALVLSVVGTASARCASPFSCSACGTRSLDFRRFARRRCALHAIACSHLLKTPRYLLGHT